VIEISIATVPPIVLAEPQLLDVGTERAALNGEVPNVEVTFDNARGELTELFALPPLRARATLTRDGLPLFTGVVQAVRLAAVISVSLER
jgi:hypothetical protein